MRQETSLHEQSSQIHEASYALLLCSAALQHFFHNLAEKYNIP